MAKMIIIYYYLYLLYNFKLYNLKYTNNESKLLI